MLYLRRRSMTNPLLIISATQISSESMATVFEKLNRKDQQEIVVLNAPASFEPEMAKLPVKTIHHHLASVPSINFFLAFVTRKSEVDALAPQIARRAKGEPVKDDSAAG